MERGWYPYALEIQHIKILNLLLQEVYVFGVVDERTFLKNNDRSY